MKLASPAVARTERGCAKDRWKKPDMWNSGMLETKADTNDKSGRMMWRTSTQAIYQLHRIRRGYVTRALTFWTDMVSSERRDMILGEAESHKLRFMARGFFHGTFYTSEGGEGRGKSRQAGGIRSLS
jgi:hypothetical protein